MTQPTTIRFKRVFDCLSWVPIGLFAILLALGILIWNTEPGAFPPDKSGVDWPGFVVFISFYLFTTFLKDDVRTANRRTYRIIIDFVAVTFFYFSFFVVNAIDLPMIQRLVFSDSALYIRAFDFLLSYLVRIMFAVDLLIFGLYLYSIRQPSGTEEPEERCSC